mmetsp:Transcript_109079/g.274475  ORF Transcript_109079/g.274475 Transcript_109079/m.274475 type:complete len:227 (-) Transcript_109079:514-1194(-)
MEFFLVPLVAAIDIDEVVPLLEDGIVDGADDLGKEEAALKRRCLVKGALTALAPTRSLPLVKIGKAHCVRTQSEFCDEVDDLRHKADVATLTPHEQVSCDLRQLHRQALVTVGGERWRRWRNPPYATQVAPVVGSAEDIGRPVLLKPLPPVQEPVKEVCVHVPDCLLEQVGLIHWQVGVNRTVCNHGALRAPKGHQVFELVFYAVNLKVKGLLQRVKEARGRLSET